MDDGHRGSQEGISYLLRELDELRVRLQRAHRANTRQRRLTDTWRKRALGNRPAGRATPANARSQNQKRLRSSASDDSVSA